MEILFPPRLKRLGFQRKEKMKRTKTQVITITDLLLSVDALNQLKKGTSEYDSQHSVICGQLKLYNKERDPAYHESISGVRTILQMQYADQKAKVTKKRKGQSSVDSNP